MSNMKIPPSQGFSELQSIKKSAHQKPNPESMNSLSEDLIQHGTTDHIRGIELPEGSVTNILGKLYSPAEEIIESTLSDASIKMPGARREALNGFHHSVAKMTQKDLDHMKDTLVDALASPRSSQWERDLLKEMYDITDAVSEHRVPPSETIKPPKFPFPMDPGFEQPIWPPHNPIDPGFNRPFPDQHKIDPGFDFDPGFVKDPRFAGDPGMIVKPDDTVDYK